MYQAPQSSYRTQQPPAQQQFDPVYTAGDQQQQQPQQDDDWLLNNNDNGGQLERQVPNDEEDRPDWLGEEDNQFRDDDPNAARSMVHHPTNDDDSQQQQQPDWLQDENNHPNSRGNKQEQQIEFYDNDQSSQQRNNNNASQQIDLMDDDAGTNDPYAAQNAPPQDGEQQPRGDPNAYTPKPRNTKKNYGLDDDDDEMGDDGRDMYGRKKNNCCDAFIHCCWQCCIGFCIPPSCEFRKLCGCPHGWCYTTMGIILAIAGMVMTWMVLRTCDLERITILYEGQKLPESVQRGYGFVSREITYDEAPDYQNCIIYQENEYGILDSWYTAGLFFTYFSGVLGIIGLIVMIAATCVAFSPHTFEHWLMWNYILASICAAFGYFIFGAQFCKENECKLGKGGVQVISSFMFWLTCANTVKSVPQARPPGDDDDDDLWYDTFEDKYRDGPRRRPQRGPPGPHDYDDDDGYYSRPSYADDYGAEYDETRALPYHDEYSQQQRDRGYPDREEYDARGKPMRDDDESSYRPAGYLDDSQPRRRGALDDAYSASQITTSTDYYLGDQQYYNQPGGFGETQPPPQDNGAYLGAYYGDDDQSSSRYTTHDNYSYDQRHQAPQDDGYRGYGGGGTDNDSYYQQQNTAYGYDDDGYSRAGQDSYLGGGGGGGYDDDSRAYYDDDSYYGQGGGGRPHHPRVGNRDGPMID